MVLRRKADMPENFVGEFTEHADDAWITANGARMVARAWTDPEYRTRMLADGTAAARELGFDFPEHHRNLAVLENTPTVYCLEWRETRSHGDSRRIKFSIMAWAFQRAAPRRTTLFAQRAPHDTPACSRSADFMKPCC